MKTKQNLSEEILSIVKNYYGVNPTENTKSRKREFYTARQSAMFFIRQKCGLSLQEIAQIFNKDHSSVLHAIRTFEEQKDFDPELKQDYKTLKLQIEQFENKEVYINGMSRETMIQIINLMINDCDADTLNNLFLLFKRNN